MAGRYALERELGRGGMGIVFLARDLALDRLVAIKLLPPTLAADPARRARFLLEARTAARLSHPNIVPIHAVEEAGGLVFFVMGYVAGETLGERVRRSGRRPANEVVAVVREVAWALAYAHRHGVVHRDVKPENILLEREGGRAMVTDFGIAQVAERADDTPAGQVVGTARAVSPEQASGEPVDGRSDLYALGVAAFYATTAEWPFDGDSAAAILAQHLTQEPPPILGLRPDLPPGLAAAIERCLAKSPADRYASGEELAAALGSALPAQRQVPAPAARAARELHELGTDMAGYGTVLLLVVALEIVGSTIGYGGALGGFASVFASIARVGVGIGMISLAGVRKVTAFRAIRDALRRGYDFADIRAALLAPEDPAPPISGARKAATAAGWLAAFGAAGAAWFWLDSAAGQQWNGLVQTVVQFAVILVPLAAGRWAAARLTAPSAKGPSLWDRWWAGRLGRWMVRLAGGKGERAAVAGAEPTELALGRAAEALFRALSAGEQARLAEVPAVLRRLEADIQALRRQETALATAQIGAAGRNAQAAQLEAARQANRARQATALAAMDSLRLDLLRATAGQAVGPGLTEHLEAAQRIGREVDARAELDS